MINILIYHNGQPIKTYQFEGNTVTLGRLESNDIPINSMAISRNHLRFEQANGGYEVSDLNSLNGSFINGEKISTVKLEASSQIVIGQFTIVSEFTPAAPLAITPSSPPEETIPDLPTDKSMEPEESIDVTETAQVDKDLLNLSFPINSSELIFSAQKSAEVKAEEELVEELRESKAVLIETNKKVINKINLSRMTIGASRDQDIFIEGGMFDEEQLATLIVEGDQYTITSLKKWKFKVNGKKVTRHTLRHKDKIEMGSSVFSFMIKDS